MVPTARKNAAGEALTVKLEKCLTGHGTADDPAAFSLRSFLVDAAPSRRLKRAPSNIRSASSLSI